MKMEIRASKGLFPLVQLSIIVAILSFTESALASPAFEILAPIAIKGHSLDDISFSPTNTMYAIDSSRNQILMYGPDDQIDGKILFEQPTAIAVSDTALYIGSSKDFSVAIRDLTGQPVGYLGQGAQEFKLPRNIAIDRETNDIYVVDQLDNSIKVYTSNGSFLRRIDDAPNLPQDVTIVGDEIFVLDQPLVTDAYGDQVRGARVSVFDMNGTLIRSFGAYGTSDGEFIRSKAITSDSQGVIYIADAFNGSVVCFDQEGDFQQTIQDPTRSLAGFMGLAIDDTGRLMVSTPLTEQMSIFSIDSTL